MTLPTTPSPPPDEDSGDRRLTWLPWTLIGTAALAIRLTALHRFSYWLDEMLEVFTIRSGWSAMWHALRDQVLNPPLDYVLQKLFDALGPSDSARRILPALWGTGGVLSIGILVGRRAAPRVGAMAAICLAFAPYHVRYSQEVRPYALGMFLTALTLLLLDRYLEEPGAGRLIAAVAAAVTVAYTMFLAALILLIAGATLILEDAATADPRRRLAARRLIFWSPALAAASAVAYSPWLPLVWRSMRAPAIAATPVFSVVRVARILSYFGFGFHDWYPLGVAGAVFIALVLVGAWLAGTTYRLRFLVVWGVVGTAAIEILEERHGVYDSIFHFIPAGVALTALAALPLGRLAEWRPAKGSRLAERRPSKGSRLAERRPFKGSRLAEWRPFKGSRLAEWRPFGSTPVAEGRSLRTSRLSERPLDFCLAVAALALVLYWDGRALASYFQRGRPDWRPVARFLRAQPPDQPILGAGAYTQLCLGYYVNGPDWLCCPGPQHRAILDVGYNASGLRASGHSPTAAWFVAPADARLAPLIRVEGIPGRLFPTADGGVVVRRIDPSAQLREDK